MRKITYYLMLLLCLMLFPHRVYALEDALDANGLSNNDTVITEEKEEEKVVEKPNEENNLLEEEEEEKKAEEVPEGEETKKVVEEEVQVGEGTKKVVEEEVQVGEETKKVVEEEVPEGEETRKVVEEEVQVGEGTRKVVEEEQEEAPMEELGEPAMITLVEDIIFTNVPSELTVGEAFPFGGDTPENAPYHYVCSAWHGYDDKAVSDNTTWNEIFQEEGRFIDTIEPDYDYNYELYVHLDDGYMFGELDEYEGIDRTVTINGKAYDAYIVRDVENDYWFYLSYTIVPFDPSAVYQESLTITNANTTPTDGREALFGAELEEENFDLVCESWYTYTYDYDEDGYLVDVHSYITSSNPDYVEDWQETFTVFTKDLAYNYGIIVVPHEGYRLKIQTDEINYTTIPITLNGEEKEVFIRVNFDENGKLAYYGITLLQDIEPITEEYSILEHANMVIDKSEGTDLAIRADGPYSLFEAVYVDGNRIDPERYTNENGETIIKLSNDYLQSLSADTHSIAISFTDGKSAFTSLIITDSSNNTSEEVSSDGTGSSSGAVVTPITYTTDSVPTTITTTSEEDNTLEPVDEEKLKEQEATKEDDEEEEEEKKNKTGLWIGLIVLLLVGIAIPVTIYRKEE